MGKEKSMNRVLTCLIILTLGFAAYFVAQMVSAVCKTDVDLEYDYYFQIILQNHDDEFKKRFFDGVDEYFEGNGYDSSSDNNGSFEKIVSGKKCCTEIVELSNYSENELCDALKSAAYAHIDAVALQPGDSSDFKDAVDFAEKSGVKIVYYQSDIVSDVSSDITEVHSYRELGKEAAEKFTEQAEPGEVILILSGNHNTLNYQKTDFSNDVYVSDYSIFQRACGVEEVLEKWQAELMKNEKIKDADVSEEGSSEKPSSQIKLDVYYLNSTEKNMHFITQKEIKQRKNLSGIICLDERSTPFLISALFDNDVDIKGKTIIGYGNTEHSEMYKDNGVISALVDDNAEKIGYDVADALYIKVGQKDEK